jgi:HlyD family secretion protein
MKKQKIVRKVLIAAAVLAAAAAVFIVVRRKNAGGKATAYVEPLSDFTGDGLASTNRFSGVVEPQDTWQVQQNPDSTVKDILVQVGDEVKKGTPLLTYDVDQYQDNLAQAEIDLERMNNEASSITQTIAELTKQQKSASSSERANLTIQLQEQDLAKKQKDIDIRSKQADIDRLKSNIANATVTSEVDGVVKSVNSGQNEGESVAYDSGSGDGQALITIMKTGDLRVKGTVNEQNIGELTEGQAVIIYSRVSSQTWRGTIASIDTENGKNQSENGSAGGYMSDDSSETGSSNYPFYVKLESSDGLMMGQHVYLEPDQGQTQKKDGLYLPEYLIDRSDEAHPFVWIDQNGKLKKQDVTLGEYDEGSGAYEITDGLKETDQIAIPDDSLREGMKTAPMSEMQEDYGTEEVTDSSYGNSYVEDEAGMYADGSSGGGR